MTDKKEFLVIRNDKIGDFMLIWPALAWLKKNIDNSYINLEQRKNRTAKEKLTKI